LLIELWRRGITITATYTTFSFTECRNSDRPHLNICFILCGADIGVQILCLLQYETIKFVCLAFIFVVLMQQKLATSKCFAKKQPHAWHKRVTRLDMICTNRQPSTFENNSFINRCSSSDRKRHSAKSRNCQNAIKPHQLPLSHTICRISSYTTADKTSISTCNNSNTVSTVDTLVYCIYYFHAMAEHRGMENHLHSIPMNQLILKVYNKFSVHRLSWTDHWMTTSWTNNWILLTAKNLHSCILLSQIMSQIISIFIWRYGWKSHYVLLCEISWR